MVGLKDFQIIVTGARGLMGEALLRHLSGLGVKVKAFVRTQPEELISNITYYQGELPDRLPDFELDESKKVILIHFASCLDSQDDSLYHKVNVEGTESLLDHFSDKIHTFVYGSSMSVYGQGPFVAVDEQAALAPQTTLAQSRERAESVIVRASKNKGFNAFIMRPRFILGKRDRSTFPALEKLSQYPFSISDESQQFSFIGVEDYAQIIISMISKNLTTTGLCDAFNIAYQRPLSLKVFLDQLMPNRMPKKWRLPVRPVIAFLGILGIKKKLRTQLQLIGLDQVLSVNKLGQSLPEICQQWQGAELDKLKQLINKYRN